MRIGHLELFVSDTDRSKRFYVEMLGFDLVAEQPGGYVWLKVGEAEILLRPRIAEGRRPMLYGDSGQGIALYVDDLSLRSSELQRRGVVMMGDDQGCPTFADPDGNWFQLVDTSNF
jgi:catechol 2,3-dioxygenase-like lactoylglutathione lyase family enzyme